MPDIIAAMERMRKMRGANAQREVMLTLDECGKLLIVGQPIEAKISGKIVSKTPGGYMIQIDTIECDEEEEEQEKGAVQAVIPSPSA